MLPFIQTLVAINFPESILAIDVQLDERPRNFLSETCSDICARKISTNEPAMIERASVASCEKNSLTQSIAAGNHSDVWELMSVWAPQRKRAIGMIGYHRW